MRSCCHFARELVLDDGFSRMDKSWVAAALVHHARFRQRPVLTYGLLLRILSLVCLG